MITPALVLFDLDGVLVHYEHAARLAVLAERAGDSPARVREILFDSGLEAESDLGRWDAAGHAAELSRRLGKPLSLDDCIRARAASMRLAEPVLDLANRVARRAEVAILTNNGWLVRDHLPRMAPALFPRFQDRVHCSAEFGVGKPDAAVFDKCLATLNVVAPAVLFIDDKAENAAGAQAAGLAAHHYTDVARLARAFAAHGLIEENDDAL